MGEFDLDLQAVEDHMDVPDDIEWEGHVVLDILDGSAPAEDRIETVLEDGHALVLAVEGDINELAAGFAREIRDAGGSLVTFRGLLILTPPGVSIDTDRV